MHLLLIVVRAVHVGLGVFWAGTMLFVATFLDPGVRASGPEGGRVMQALQRRRYLQTMLTVGTLTVLSGLVLYWRMSGGNPPGWMRSRYGMTLSIGALAGIGALGIGWFVSRPTFRRLGALTATPPSPDQQAEIQRLHDRLTGAVRWVAVLLSVAVLTMALARFL
jgi:uncharacterized membrane protein